MSSARVNRYETAHGEVGIFLDASLANRILLALERLDQESGLDPALGELRELVKTGLVSKSSGDIDSAPSSGE